MATTIQTMAFGPMGNLLYLLRDEATGAVALIDPAWDAEALVTAALALGHPEMILLTHTHGDHVNAVPEVRQQLSLPLFVSAASSGWRSRPADAQLIDDGDVLFLGDSRIEVMATPGHSRCSLVFRMVDRALVGDTLFVYGCGHCRLPGSDPEALYRSLCRLQRDLAPDMPLHCGHDYGTAPVTTMAAQIAGNPYLHCQSQDEFQALRIGRPGRTMPFRPVDGIPAADSPWW